MKESKKSMDLLHGPLHKNLILFALPIALCSMLQQLFNAADTSVVGRFGNPDALAAVGTNGEIVALLVTLSAGLSVGANVLAAAQIGKRETGKKEAGSIPNLVSTAVLSSFLLGIFIAAIGQLLVLPLLTAIHTPQEILPSAASYLRIYLLGYPFLMLYDFTSALLRARGDSRRPFLALTASGILNVLLNLFFVIVCRLDVAGVAIATDLSTACSAFLVLLCLAREKSEFRLSRHRLHFSVELFLLILRIGIPSAVQGAVFCLANIFVQSAVNRFGAVATAGSTIAMNFEYFGYYMITAFGQAATTFTSQNFAAGQKKRCRSILFSSLLFSVLFSACITVPLTVFRSASCSLFSTDTAVIEAACLRISIILLFEPICCFYEIPSGVLRGAGHSTLPAALTVLGTCAVRIAWIFFVFPRFQTQESLFIVFPISWVITILLTGCGYLAVRPF